MTRVLEVFGEPISMGGQESYVMNALMHMDLTDIHVDMFTPYYCDNARYEAFINMQGGIVVQCGIPFKVGGTRKEIIPAFKAYLKKTKYDVVHIHSGSISVLAYYAREASKAGVKRVIVHSHSSGVKENIKHLLIKIYASGLFEKYATDYFACSLQAAEWKYPKKLLNQTKILKNGVDVERFKFNPEIRSGLRKEYQITDDTLVLGHVGRFTHEKNQSFLIDVLSECYKKYEDLRIILMLIGDGDLLEDVKAKVRTHGLDEKVIFLGAKDNVHDYMQMFDVFLFPSLYEGLGIVGIEAQASGLPVIASKGIPETMKITERVSFIDLNCIELWCDDIFKNHSYNFDRSGSATDVIKNGFDVNETAKELRKIYTV